MPRLGPYTLHAIETGTLRLDGGAMFGIVPKPLWERRAPADAENRITLAMRCLLLVGAGRVILVDTGVGEKYDDKFATIYGIDHSQHTLAGSLAEVGVAPSDVTDVILTHLHFDHVGGATRREGDALVPTFPNARHHVQHAHWDWARGESVREQASFRDDNLGPLSAHTALRFAQGDGPLDAEVLPGITVRCMHGHTEAQQVVLVGDPSGNDPRTLAYVADLLPTTAHLAPAWTMGYDIRPMQTIAEKAALLAEAERENWTLMFEHDPDVEIGEVESTSRGPVVVRPRALVDW